ncbi:peptidylprolyl isomerase [Poseidonocella sedimentorum]|uniref:Parvulin-like PPIase n=1 Tax=Poseidonocella sedimentorum TaxID=871652 RepID=A0A1I6DYY9_9RHOB|nr:peptidylprolyl isomerase [Poseidonocella sedimentorum]SFR10750.1 periplasmic chaperone for outer membrane proteins SurA [Poseidonocella sedimentorum]
MRRFSPLAAILALPLCLGLGLLSALPASLSAQALFSPVIRVNDQVITAYELRQRERLLQALRNPGDLGALAREGLIEDRLRREAARAAGLALTDEQIREGMTEFAGRANLSLEQFLQVLASQGVDAATLRDFVEAGMGWRELVRARFSARAQVSEDEIDRALAGGSGDASGVRVLLSEIILPAPPGEAAAAQATAERISRLTSIGAFAAEARALSYAPTRDQGGRINWMPLSQLPPALRGIVLGLTPGEVSDPLPLENAIALFQLRAIEETGAPEQSFAAIDYASFYLAGGRSEETLAQAARIAARADSCDDLYGAAKGLPEEQLERSVLPPDQVPQDVAIELAKLDPGETSTMLTRNEGQTLVLLMLCGRTAEAAEGADRGTVATQLRNAKLAAFADSYMAELKADALIVEE